MQERRRFCGAIQPKGLTWRLTLCRSCHCSSPTDGLRSEADPLDVRSKARLVVPEPWGDSSSRSDRLRLSQPRGAQHGKQWRLLSADVNAAFLKGEPFVDREFYLTNASRRRRRFRQSEDQAGARCSLAHISSQEVYKLLLGATG